MAYDEALVERVRDVVGVRPRVAERKMFGALAWFIGGEHGVRRPWRGAGRPPRAARRPSASSPSRMSARSSTRGRRMGGFVVVGPEGIASDEELARWVDCGADYAASLPPK